MSKIIRRRSVYSKEQLPDAVRAVKGGKMSSVKAAQVYNVPGSTIRTHVKNSSLSIDGGRRFYLNSNQENYLVELTKCLEIIGVRLTKMVLKKVIGEYIKMLTNDVRLQSKCVFSDVDFL